MQIGIICDGLPPWRIGGVEVHALRVAKEFAKRRHKVYLITPYPKDKISEIIDHEDGNLRLITFNPHKKPFLFMKGVTTYIKKLLSIREKIDIVYAQTLLAPGYASILSRNFTKTPIVVRAHGMDVFVGGYHWEIKYFSRTTSKKADALLVTTEFMKNLIVKDFGVSSQKIHVIPYGLDTNKFKPKRKTGSTILTVCRLDKRKGIEYLIKAMKSVNAKLVIVGDGEEKEKLIRLKKRLGLSNVEFKGYLLGKELLDYYGNSDIFVLPSIVDKSGNTEGFGIAFLEAMACKMPCIGTNVGGIPEVIKDNETGFIVPSGNTKILAEKINLLLNNESLREKMGENAYKLVRTEYQMDKTIDRTLTVFKRILNAK